MQYIAWDSGSHLETDQPPKTGAEYQDEKHFSNETNQYQQKLGERTEIDDHLSSTTEPTEGLYTAPDQSDRAQEAHCYKDVVLRLDLIILVNNFKPNLKANMSPKLLSTNQLLHLWT